MRPASGGSTGVGRRVATSRHPAILPAQDLEERNPFRLARCHKGNLTIRREPPGPLLDRPRRYQKGQAAELPEFQVKLRVTG